jgi:Inosine-uridine nucleoside N-ribohydrolase
MKRMFMILAFMASCIISTAQVNLTDKELVNFLWGFAQAHPDGFTIDINTFDQPTEGLMVSYIETQNSFDKKSIPAVIKHAREHNGLVGGWYNPQNGKYYFDSTRMFPEDSLVAAVKFARENQQHTVYVASKDINIKSNFQTPDNRIIYDCDMGSSTDDLFALMMLYRYMEMGRCELLGVIIDRMGAANADAVDVLNNFYGFPNIPIGLEREGVKRPQVWISYHNFPYARDNDANLLFKRSIMNKEDYMDGYKLYRKLLASQPDKSVKICSVGFLTTLSRLLESGPDEYSPLSGVELVEQKVSDIYAMGGVFGKAVEPDYNFAQAIDYSLKFFELLPKSINVIFSPGEVGDPLDYRPELVLKDIDWTDQHPIRWIYKFTQCDTGQKMWDPLAVINAVEGDGAFVLSERGWVELTPDAETIFTPDPEGNCRYQKPGGEKWADMILKYIRLMNIQH